MRILLLFLFLTSTVIAQETVVLRDYLQCTTDVTITHPTVYEEGTDITVNLCAYIEEKRPGQEITVTACTTATTIDCGPSVPVGTRWRVKTCKQTEQSDCSANYARHCKECYQ